MSSPKVSVDVIGEIAPKSYLRVALNHGNVVLLRRGDDGQRRRFRRPPARRRLAAARSRRGGIVRQRHQSASGPIAAGPHLLAQDDGQTVTCQIRRQAGHGDLMAFRVVWPLNTALREL